MKALGFWRQRLKKLPKVLAVFYPSQNLSKARIMSGIRYVGSGTLVTNSTLSVDA